ncbi:30S ribosomal protein 3 [Hibiscus syriacus]|uniref:30S ribosomal protein 3 n=1 Tax=Hibiscus syriacus TaxID=106335 RepID=A0A6A3BV52_HIBSY|nr:30S ribosomal protein 3-1, chloroplastic-like [Hibiscus syriacus]KAE8719771.1 30S ribosomal protein 3 [Hibiscus syriacus]
MLSMATPLTVYTTFTLHFGHHKSSDTTICFKANPSLKKRTTPTFKGGRLTASAALTAETSSETEAPPITVPQKYEVAVKQVGKPRMVLKFIWMEKNIGLALDQVIPGHGTVPLSPYFFWPRKDAWEELKATLESKPWISQKKMIILLNQATDVINLWQQSGGNLSQS